MALKIVTFFLTLIVNIAAGVAVLLVMLVAMNGYSESDALYGIVAFLFLALSVSLLMATLAALVAARLVKREYTPIVSGLIAVTAFSIVGAILKAVCCIIGIGISEFVRVNF